MTFLENYIVNLVFLLFAALVFIPLEHLLPRVSRNGLKRDGLKLDLAYMLLGSALTMVAATLFVTIVIVTFSNFIPDSVKEGVGSMPFWLQLITLIVVSDFYYYWAHRLFHTVPFLWKFHSIHHSIEEMDWVAAHRTHPIDTAITNSGAILLTLLFDFSIAAFAIATLQFSWHSLLKHSNVNVGWGPLRWIYLTPTFHHWHHANVQEAYDKNFSGQLPVWDLLFGTAVMNEKEGPERYGVDDPVPPTFLGSLLYPIRHKKMDSPE